MTLSRLQAANPARHKPAAKTEFPFQTLSHTVLVNSFDAVGSLQIVLILPVITSTMSSVLWCRR